MIAKYKGQYFKVNISTNPVNIWTFFPTEEFFQGITRRGTVYYEKYVPLSEIEQVFNIGFSVNWDGQWCGIFYAPEKNLISLHTTNRNFALSHDMNELERGAYSIGLSADLFKEYRVWKRDVLKKTETHTIVSFEEFKKLWKQFHTDLMPPR